ncbi:hypothetical protein GOV10_00715 [Candidatus Woesearchaeota archaeon]|nr:hypothetical protein [Candidatus Woesearchaeota archaeon]
MFSSLFGALGLSMIPYFREQKKYYDTYRGVIDEQRKDINQSLEKIFQHIDDKVEIIKERREKDADL